jgi:hypothetical protein
MLFAFEHGMHFADLGSMVKNPIEHAWHHVRCCPKFAIPVTDE